MGGVNTSTAKLLTTGGTGTAEAYWVGGGSRSNDSGLDDRRDRRPKGPSSSLSWGEEDAFEGDDGGLENKFRSTTPW